MQRCAVNLFDENMCPINLADVRTRNGARQVFSAAPAEDWRDSRSRPEGKWVVFATHWTTVSERALVNMTMEQGRKGPFPTNVHIRMFPFGAHANSTISRIT